MIEARTSIAVYCQYQAVQAWQENGLTSRFRLAFGVPLIAVFCSGCLGLPAPDGGIWRIVEKTGPSNSVQNGSSATASLGGLLHGYLVSKLPLSPRQLVQTLNAEHFTCDHFGEDIEGGTTKRIPEGGQITCWYSARGAWSVDNACRAGAAIIVEVSFRGPEAITDLDVTEMSFADPSAHAGGLCAPF